MPIYTRRGDKGYTTLFPNREIPKHHPCVHFIGEVDEAMSAVGLAIEQSSSVLVRKILMKAYRLLSEVAASPYTGKCPGGAEIDELEEEIDSLPAPRLFIPDYSEHGRGVAVVSLARTAIRRAERWFWACYDEAEGAMCTEVGKLLNRLSDYVFMAQYAAYLESRGARR